MFLAFWKEYPRKHEKRTAFESWVKMDQPTQEKAIDGAMRYAVYCKKIDREMDKIKHASTWLNKHCWEDDYTCANGAKKTQGELNSPDGDVVY